MEVGYVLNQLDTSTTLKPLVVPSLHLGRYSQGYIFGASKAGISLGLAWCLIIRPNKLVC
jgi:hypothetical protein